MLLAGRVYDAYLVKFKGACAIFCDYDQAFHRFVHQCRLEETGETAGLEMKLMNTLVEPWPMRLKEDATQDEFDILLGSGHVGSERYVEWRSTL